ncbi:MAG: nucleotidyl transferase AbiEii/AbiGii toxin family protein [Methanomassiliicoccales archaeon]|nr:MAG: nucleotidyl transferase AbiEii/AbiGii toxin family protein [Methanomassiliicoccales archaeon]
MNREDLRRYIGVTGYSLGQVEKDYFQHIVLGALSRKMAGLLVFKGGTALQKTGLLPRFSEDLDFTITGRIALDKLEETARTAVESYNYVLDLNNFVDDERTLGFRLKIQGPLYRNLRGICTVRIEASKREEVLLSPRRTEINPPYHDILPYTLVVMDLEEIAAEKVRTIYTRDRPRDVYDLYRLIEGGTQMRKELANVKLEYYDMKFNKKEFLKRCEHISRRWQGELGSLLEVVPAKREVLKAIEKAF